MSKHTPGPWKAEVDHVVARRFIDGKLIILNDGNSIAKVFGPDKAANSRIIATAPELLQMLREARKAIASLLEDGLGMETESSGRHWWSLRDELLARIDSVFVKAIGEEAR
jgi:hypothetical protein